MRLLRLFVFTVAIAVLAPLAFGAAAQPGTQPEICFPGVPSVNACIDPAFAAYWQRNGGLPVFGYPLAPREAYRPPEASAPLTIQWTERNRMELHPQNPPAYQVQIGRVGAERLAQLGRNPAADGPEAGPQTGCLWFAATRHNVCDQGAGQGFKSYWENNGLRVEGLGDYEQSLALFGLPLTAANPEPSANGELVLTQWFERARLEWHPAQPAEFRVLLGLLGREVRGGLANSPAPQPSGQPATQVAPTIPVFGAEVTRGTVAAVAGRISEANLGWVRYNGVLWDQIEPRRGQRQWQQLAQVETELRAISATGASPILIVRRVPLWARVVADKPCGPIKPDALDEFAAFMGELVTRLSQPPYNVKYWELGNEPDAAYQVIGGEDAFGCWGDETDPLYGGGAYAAMLKAAYPAIKAADPEAKVILGGLLLDCDPTKANAQRPCPSGNFLEGVLRAGGGAFFDVLAYHSYIYWGPVTVDWDIYFPPWSHRGGALRGKLSLIREVMARHNVDKPIIMNEGGLLCYRNSADCEPGGVRAAQANYAVRLYSRVWAEGLLGAVWYTLDGPGWQDGGLLDGKQQPRAAFTTLRFLSGLLADASFERTLASGALEGYAFRKGNLSYQIYWTNDGSTAQVPLPAGASAVYTMLGERNAPPSTGPLAVGFEPLIIEATGP